MTFCFRATGVLALAAATAILLVARPGPVVGQSAPMKLTYELKLSDKRMGSQTYQVTTLDGANQSFQVDTKMNIDFSPFIFKTVKVQMVTREMWQGGRLASFASKTVDRGEKFAVTAQADGTAVRITSGGKAVQASSAVVPGSYWYEPLFKERTEAFDTKTGRLQKIKISFVDTPVVKYKGKEYPTRHYQVVEGDGDTRDIWYFETGIMYRISWPEQMGFSVIYTLQ